ncbi:unannotated protein [freshwater metagenome]|uniref:Unannotated protein n=1 Tax=freshwater metagenome TaxID=449393 RepID=A0A6J7P6V1_9ZZZZ|nr:FMN-binding protein [Actinomycetota bacterium]
MKRALLIATGTVGGLGAVLAVTPPQFTSTQSSPMALPGSDTTPAAAASRSSSPSATAAATKSAKAKASKSASSSAQPTKSAAATKAANSNAGQAQTPAADTPAATPTPTQTKTTAASNKSASGTFTGDSINVRYGYVQVKITVENGKITDAQAVQAPSGRNDRWTQMAVPILRQQTLKAQSANINGASGASFTSYGWYTSLVSALAKAGM